MTAWHMIESIASAVNRCTFHLVWSVIVMAALVLQGCAEFPPQNHRTVSAAKTFSVDRSAVFVGSFNFDPRSARLNTELGFVIECPAMAVSIADAVSGMLVDRAYRVRLGPDGALQWVEQVAGKDVVHDEESGAGFWRQLGASVLSLLPIEWLL